MLRDAGRFKFLRDSHELKSKSELENLILALQLRFLRSSESIGHHDSERGGPFPETAG